MRRNVRLRHPRRIRLASRHLRGNMKKIPIPACPSSQWPASPTSVISFPSATPTLITLTPKTSTGRVHPASFLTSSAFRCTFLTHSLSGDVFLPRCWLVRPDCSRAVADGRRHQAPPPRPTSGPWPRRRARPRKPVCSATPPNMRCGPARTTPSPIVRSPPPLSRPPSPRKNPLPTVAPPSTSRGTTVARA